MNSMRILGFALLFVLSSCTSWSKAKPRSGTHTGMFDRDDPNDAPGDVLEGPAGEANSPGLNFLPKDPPRRR
jgi:hypothetical protein